MALDINISSYVSGGYTNPILWRLYETGSGVLVDEHTEAGPHGRSYQFSFVNNIIDIVYTIKMYEVIATVPNFIKGMDITVSTTTINIDTDIELIVDGGESYDPVNGATSVTVPDTIGKSCKLVQRGFGKFRETRSPEYTHDTVTGEFVLLGGVTFNADDTYFIEIAPVFVINPPGTVQPTSYFKSVTLITANTTLSTLDFGKLFICDGANPVLTLQLPAISTMIEKVPMWIESVGTNNINVVIKCATGETISAIGTTSNTFILGKGERCQIIKLGSTLYGFTDCTDIKRVGQFDWGYISGPNRLWADGSEYNVADYPRLKKAMDTSQVGTVLDYTTWATTQTIDGVAVAINKGKFALKGDGLKFKVPDLRNLSIRALNGTGTDTERRSQGPGGYQYNDVQPHKHGSGIYKIGTAGHFSYGSGGGWILGTTDNSGGLETRPSNIGLIPLIII